MKEKLSDYQEKYGDLYNLEATPAESTSYRLAKKDRELYPDIITASDDKTPYYTNSSHLPVGYTDDLFKALDIQDELQTLYTSGTVFHCFLGERIPDWKACANLVKKIAENYRLPYYTMSPTYSVCKNHGYLVGEVKECPVCGEKTEIYSRITGYYRPIANWNDGKAKEYEMRKEYKLIKGGKFDSDKGSKSEKKEEKKEAKSASSSKSKAYLLFGTKTCPNCEIVKKKLKAENVAYEFIDAEEMPDLTQEYEVMSAPTLISLNDEGYEKVVNASNIISFIDKHNV
jgi:ribonucleoside-triphosphate reductase